MPGDDEVSPAQRGHRALVFDFGTTSLKAALVEDERILAETNEGYPVSVPHDGWAEQDPAELWDVAGSAGRELMSGLGESPETIDSVVFIAPWKAIIPVSEAGEVLRPAIIWLDARAHEEAEELNREMGEFVGTGQEIWPRLMWCRRNEPGIWAASKWIMGLVTYFKWRATGEVATEPSDDFVTSPVPELAARYAEILERAGLAEETGKFPPARPSSELVGSLTPEAAEHLGLAPGTGVRGGFGDLPAITLGSGPVEEGASHLYIGTSSWFAVVTRDADRLAPPLTFTHDEAHRVALYPLQTAGMAFDWIVRELYGYEQAHLDEELLDRVNRDVAEIPAGSDRLLATHWLNGELPPLDKTARGAYINLTPSHDRRHMVRAMMESLCYTHRASIEAYQESSGRAVEEVVCTGGGASSAVWMQMMADVLRRPVVVPANPRYTGVIGGFRASALGSGDRYEPAVPPASTHEPDARNADVYDEMFAHYQAVFPALKDLFARMNDRKAEDRRDR